MWVEMVRTGEVRRVSADYGLRLVSMGRARVCAKPPRAEKPADKARRKPPAPVPDEAVTADEPAGADTQGQ